MALVGHVAVGVEALGDAVGVLDRHVVAVQQVVVALEAGHARIMQRGCDTDMRHSANMRHSACGCVAVRRTHVELTS